MIKADHPRQHLNGTFRLDTRLFGGLTPEKYRIEAVLCVFCRPLDPRLRYFQISSNALSRQTVNDESQQDA